MNSIESELIGLSSVRDEPIEISSEAHVFDLPGYNDFSDTETVYSSNSKYDRDLFEFIEL